ncbi:hypothetical protein GA0115254_104113 [Streptomyces sp. Ncost-T10-10d]|nr:hypothetical protein GA0115254_104113 [Streptomyces sp. Ncost-T10-10d]
MLNCWCRPPKRAGEDGADRLEHLREQGSEFVQVAGRNDGAALSPVVRPPRLDRAGRGLAGPAAVTAAGRENVSGYVRSGYDA